MCAGDCFVRNSAGCVYKYHVLTIWFRLVSLFVCYGIVSRVPSFYIELPALVSSQKCVKTFKLQYSLFSFFLLSSTWPLFGMSVFIILQVSYTLYFLFFLLHSGFSSLSNYVTPFFQHTHTYTSHLLSPPLLLRYIT